MKTLPLALAALLATTAAGFAQTEDMSQPLAPKDVHWSFESPVGTFDRAAWQRGF